MAFQFQKTGGSAAGFHGLVAKDFCDDKGGYCAVAIDQVDLLAFLEQPVPQPVLNVSAAWQLAVGKYHACVLITTNTPGTKDIMWWGLNTDGQLGNGTYVNSPVPVFVK
jgi:hypothetical protein